MWHRIAFVGLLALGVSWTMACQSAGDSSSTGDTGSETSADGGGVDAIVDEADTTRSDGFVEDFGAAEAATDTGLLPDAPDPSDVTDVADVVDVADVGAPSTKRGFPEAAPWVSFYGTATEMGDLAAVAAKYRILNIDADPTAGNFTKAQITTLKNAGKNRVISYFNLGSCENYRSYWAKVPSGFVSCKDNVKAHAGAYDGYPDEEWMNVGDADYQRLIVDHVAPMLVAQGIDGFFFDNLEIVEHGTATKNGPCNAACAQGGLDLVAKLRAKYPDLLFVLQNGTGSFTRTGKSGGLSFPSLLDGISHEEVYEPYDIDVEKELLAWQAMALKPGGRAFWIATEDYVGKCSATVRAKAILAQSAAKGFSPYVTDASSGQKVICGF